MARHRIRAAVRQHRRGTKAPGFNFAIDGTGILGSSTIEQIPFDEENLTAYEMGVKTELFNGTTRLNSAAFYYDYDDFQAFSFEGITNVVSNKPAEISGLEVEITSRPTENLELTLGAAPGWTLRSTISSARASLLVKQSPAPGRWCGARL